MRQRPAGAADDWLGFWIDGHGTGRPVDCCITKIIDTPSLRTRQVRRKCGLELHEILGEEQVDGPIQGMRVSASPTVGQRVWVPQVVNACGHHSRRLTNRGGEPTLLW